MPRHTDKDILVDKHYSTEDKLVFRKKYNSFIEPKINLENEFIQRINEVNAKNVLDVGCGNGDLLISLRKSGFKGKLTGLELSKGILQPGIDINNKDNLYINFLIGDAENLPFEDEVFDVIIAKHMLYHLSNISKGIDEAHRCLKNGGIYIITLNGEDNNPKHEEIEEIICEKYKIKTVHGKFLVCTENVGKLLTNFKKVDVVRKVGKMNRPEMFADYFESLKDNYEPEPDEDTWKKILFDVKQFVENKMKEDGEFIETRSCGVIVATK